MSSAARPQAQAAAWRIKPREETDWPDLLTMWVDAWRATYPQIDFERRRDWLVDRIESLEAAGAATALLYDGANRIAGFVVVHPTTGWLDQICVRPDLFGSGAAATLLAEAQKLSPLAIRLDVNADNARARAFYVNRGFLCIGAGQLSQSGRETVVMEWRPERNHV